MTTPTIHNSSAPGPSQLDQIPPAGGLPSDGNGASSSSAGAGDGTGESAPSNTWELVQKILSRYIFFDLSFDDVM